MRTRAAVAAAGVDNDELVPPPRRRPSQPRPPPPPPPRKQNPPHRPTNPTLTLPHSPRAENSQERIHRPLHQEKNQEQYQEQSREQNTQLLYVRHPRCRTIRRIHISSHITHDVLAACLQQSLSLDYVPIGLYEEATETYYALSDVLVKGRQQPTSDDGPSVYCTAILPPMHIVDPWWRQHAPEVVLVVLLMVFYYWFYHDSVTATISWLVLKALSEIHMEWPLQQLYRHGPAWLGFWQGASLPHICARITHHQDELFWRTHATECQRMFENKQHSFVRSVQPIVWGCMLWLVWRTIMMILMRRRQQPLISSELDQALQVLARHWRQAGAGRHAHDKSR